MLIGLQALELAPKKAVGTAAGFTGLFGYLGGSVAAIAFMIPTLRHKNVASEERAVTAPA